MSKTYVDLVIDNGELIRIECPSKFEDELYESIEHTMKRRDWFSVMQWDGCSATYMGMRLDRVNMGRVVAAL